LAAAPLLHAAAGIVSAPDKAAHMSAPDAAPAPAMEGHDCHPAAADEGDSGRPHHGGGESAACGLCSLGHCFTMVIPSPPALPASAAPDEYRVLQGAARAPDLPLPAEPPRV
jgi:hypothetical protein